MKHLLMTLIMPAICLSCFSQAVITKLASKDSSHTFTFPVISLADKTVAQKINDFLQAKELKNTTKKVKAAQLFDRVKYIFRNDSTIQSGIDELGYAIESNNAKLLSVKIEGETIAAYPAPFTNYYNFNIQNGELLVVEELFIPAGLQKIEQMLIDKRKLLIKKALADMKKDKATKDDLDIAADGWNECNKGADVRYFSLHPKEIIFHKGSCFPHAAANLDINLDISLTFAELRPLMTGFGAKALLQEDAVIKDDHFPSTYKVMYGTIDNKYPIVMQFDRVYENTVYGFYFYSSQGISVELSGTVTGNNIELTEYNENGDKMATFTGTINGPVITGTWSDPATKRQLPFAVKN